MDVSIHVSTYKSGHVFPLDFCIMSVVFVVVQGGQLAIQFPLPVGGCVVVFEVFPAFPSFGCCCFFWVWLVISVVLCVQM